MMLQVDLEQEQVEAPLGNWCASGHQAPSVFRRLGPNSMAEPTRFFLIKGHGINGIYCEPCLAIANHMAKLKKQGMIKE
jgi:hypothetical protein